ncbi:hypothetical protein KDH_71580 [Dictyobacter sp. S3.2.2.5]|uniref:Uncharacterized protein n=1 Tax=Dictyobacter halimunensis TaxID=3026934 RepID=A0ABQ6G1F9_9CHLR|nr:hypothetical protein KDH_71580 [Dictyobacter sp. S3.2.2.5]
MLHLPMLQKVKIGNIYLNTDLPGLKELRDMPGIEIDDSPH